MILDISKGSYKMKDVQKDNQANLDDGGISDLMASIDPTGGWISDPFTKMLGDNSPDNSQSPNQPQATNEKEDEAQQSIDDNMEALDEFFDIGNSLGQSIMSLGTGDTIANAVYNPTDAISNMMSPSMANSSDSDGGEKDLSEATSQMDSVSKSSGKDPQQMIQQGMEIVEDNPEIVAAVL
jgi:hypothetical protein